MTPADFKAWRKRVGLTHAELLATLHRLGYLSLTQRGIGNWGSRGVPEHMMPALTLMERAPQAWKVPA